MSQLILDEQLSLRKVFRPLAKWITVQRLAELRPFQQILDDRVPEILLSLRRATFVTIDKGFWDRRVCNRDYCILYFALRDDQQQLIPDLLRALLRRPEFRTRAKRMGKVARISTTTIEYWQPLATDLQRLVWAPRIKR